MLRKALYCVTWRFVGLFCAMNTVLKHKGVHYGQAMVSTEVKKHNISRVQISLSPDMDMAPGQSWAPG